MNIFKFLISSYLIVTVSAFYVGPSQAAEWEVYTLEPRPNVKMDVKFATPKKATAIVIFMGGGRGSLDMDSNTGNGLGYRTVDLFLANGIAVAMPNAPSDQTLLKGNDPGPFGMGNKHRISRKHLADVGSIVSWMKEKKMPVWLVGISSGPVSVANFASQGNQKIEGIVLLSPVTLDRKGKKKNRVLNIPLNKITVPALVIAQENDECARTPISGSKAVHKAMTSSTNAKIKIITGGDSGPGCVCCARSHHDFWENEEELVSNIIAFIKESKK